MVLQLVAHMNSEIVMKMNRALGEALCSLVSGPSRLEVGRFIFGLWFSVSKSWHKSIKLFTIQQALPLKHTEILTWSDLALLYLSILPTFVSTQLVLLFHWLLPLTITVSHSCHGYYTLFESSAPGCDFFGRTCTEKSVRVNIVIGCDLYEIKNNKII